MRGERGMGGGGRGAWGEGGILLTASSLPGVLEAAPHLLALECWTLLPI